MKFLTLIAVAVFAMSLTACNTIEGAGKDIKAGGQAISNGAENVKDKM